MSRAPEPWPALSYLEALRPGPEETVDLALLSSYSADLGCIGAALLALAGRDNDSGGGTALDFAEAVQRLRGKTRVLVQRGRLARMRRTPRVAAVLDQFVREVGLDESQGSWHAKAAFVRMRRSDGTHAWRLWLGSRNLTQCANLDLGLLLLSDSRGGEAIEGLDELVGDLLRHADLPGASARTLAASAATLRWRAPAGTRVKRLRWSPGGRKMELPEPPPDAREVAIVSPFVDPGFLKRFSRLPLRRSLLTTVAEVERLGPALPSFDALLTLDAPNAPAADAIADTDTDTDAPAHAAGDGLEDERSSQGLHAKALFFKCAKQRCLWLGSANATQRGWDGRNAEVMALLAIDERVEQGLRALLGSARVTPPRSQARVAEAEAEQTQALEQARAQVAARWAAELAFEPERTRLFQAPGGAESPHPDAADLVLQVACLQGAWQVWPRGQGEVALEAVPAAERSEFVQLRLSQGGSALSWLQRARAQPCLDEDRDNAAFVRFLGTRGFLAWLAALLEGDEDGQGSGDWTVEEKRQRDAGDLDKGRDACLPTLEGMLAAWSRDRERFEQVGQRVERYLSALSRHAESQSAEEAALLAQFRTLWDTLADGLMGPHARKRAK